jgi:hypothetical protein
MVEVPFRCKREDPVEMSRDRHICNGGLEQLPLELPG